MRTVNSRFQLLFLSLVVAIGFGLRVVHLNELPLSLSHDEAINGADALRLFRAGWLIPFLQNNFGRETLYFYLQSLALQLYGISFFSLRFVSVLVGTATIPLMYRVGQRLRLDHLLTHRPPLNVVGMLAATGLAISYWHLYFSRLGLRGILLPPLLLGLVWCFWKGWHTPHISGSKTGHRRLWLVAAGLLLGLSFYTYLAARLLPLLFTTFLALEVAINRSDWKRRSVDFLTLVLASVLVAVPLAVYFYQNPHAISARAQTISVFAGDAPFRTLISNLIAVLRIHLFAGTWLGWWPALNVLSSLGFLVGLLVCLFHVRRTACRFLLLWWVIGVTPTIFSQQDWEAATTILRSIVAWPAIFLISALGLTTLVNTVSRWAANRGRIALGSDYVGTQTKWRMACLFLFLFLGGFVTSYNYFAVWANTYNERSVDDPIYLAEYLNGRTNQATLIPLELFKERVTNFLLQARYPDLSNIEVDSLRTLLESMQRASPGQVPAVYLLPDKPATIEGDFVLLVPASDGSGTAYLLPRLTPQNLKALSNHQDATAPLSEVLNGKQEPIAHVYPLGADAPFLPDEPIPFQPLKANFNHDVWLTGYRVEPAVAEPGDTVTLYLKWRMYGPVDGDYYVFVHLFDIPQAQRRGQANLPLNGVIHRWSGPLTFLDTYHFWLPPDSPEGVYRFEMGLYHNFSLERLPVIMGEANQPPEDRILLGKFHVRLHPPSPPEYPVHAQFGNSLVLAGGDFPERTLHPGQVLTYTLHWQAIDSIAQDYTVFNHLLDVEGNIVAQRDSMPQQDQYPTSLWDAGEIVMDQRSIPLPTELEPGAYSLRIGLYESETGQRLPLVNEARDFVELPHFVIIESVK